jgi:2Fe-2S ferredoxin
LVKVIFVQPNGDRSELQVPSGTTGMEAARARGIEGIVAECGGSAACATCHVYVDTAFLPKLAPPEAQEAQMLDCTASERKPNSRLSCQIPLTEDVDGIILNIPPAQL